MHRVAIYLGKPGSPSQLQQAFREVRAGFGRIVTLVQEEDGEGSDRAALRDLTARLRTGEFDRIATLASLTKTAPSVAVANRVGPMANGG